MVSNLSRGDRIYCWIMSCFAAAMFVFICMRGWTGIKWSDRLGVVIVGIVAIRLPWLQMQSRQRDNQKP